MTDKKKQVIYFLPDNGIGGGAAVVLQHIYRLNKLGLKSKVVSINNKIDFSWFPYKVPILPYEKYKFSKSDIIVATWWETAFMLANKKSFGRFYFVQSDESRFYSDNNINKKLVYLSYLFNYNYFTEAKWLKDFLFQNFSIKSEYIPNGVDLNIFHKTNPLIPKNNNKLRILIEGPAVLPWKGVEDAFKVVKDMNVEVWYISSAGKPKKEWKIDKFFYKVPMNKMKEIYSSCDVLLKMSKVEGFFGPPLEMMACGGTAIVTKVTGFDEYIVDGQNAFVVEIGNIKKARYYLKKLIKDRKLLLKMKRNGINTAKKHTWDKSIKKLYNLYMNYYKNPNKEQILKNNTLFNIYNYLRDLENSNNDLINELTIIKNSKWWKLREKIKRYYRPLFHIYKKLR